MQSDTSVDGHEKCRHPWEKDLPVICPVNDGFLEALDYSTYFFFDKSSGYDKEVGPSVAKLASHLQIQMEFQTCDEVDPISIINFMSAFKLASHTTGVQEGAALWMLQVLTKRPAAVALNAPISFHSKSHRRQMKGMVALYCEAVKYFLKQNKALNEIDSTASTC